MGWITYIVFLMTSTVRIILCLSVHMCLNSVHFKVCGEHTVHAYCSVLGSVTWCRPLPALVNIEQDCSGNVGNYYDLGLSQKITINMWLWPWLSRLWLLLCKLLWQWLNVLVPAIVTHCDSDCDCETETVRLRLWDWDWDWDIAWPLMPWPLLLPGRIIFLMAI